MTFHFERLDVYRASLEAIDVCTSIIGLFPRGNGSLADQMRRAVASVALNISEGSGEFKPHEKARFYRMALRSAAETCAIAQIGARLKIVSPGDYQSAYQILTRVTEMLTKLIAAMEKR